MYGYVCSSIQAGFVAPPGPDGKPRCRTYTDDEYNYLVDVGATVDGAILPDLNMGEGIEMDSRPLECEQGHCGTAVYQNDGPIGLESADLDLAIAFGASRSAVSILRRWNKVDDVLRDETGATEFKGGGKTGRKVNQKRYEAASKRIEDLRKQYDALDRTPNKTPELKKKLAQIKRQIDKEISRKGKSPNHANSGQGNRR